jgi:Flp pilus assembly protein TadG
MMASKSYAGLTRAAGKFRTTGRVLRREQSGSALVEFALSAVLLITMLFGIIEFGFALYTYQFVNEVARELTRYSIVRGSQCTAMPNCGYTDSTSTAQAYAQAAYNYPGMDMSKLTVTNTWYAPVKNSNGTISSWAACAGGSGCNKPGYMVQVNVTYPFILNIPFVPSRNMSVSSSSSMVISQ